MGYNTKRVINREFQYSRLFEAVLPGVYKVSVSVDAEITDAEFRLRPGDTYQDLLDVCEGFCEGLGDPDARTVAVKRIVQMSTNPLNEGLVLERDAEDRLEQGNIFLTPEQLKNVLKMIERSAYGKRTPLL